MRHVDITGGGPFRLLPGQVTDDTHMAICLWRSLRDDGVDRDALIAEYVAWAAVSFDVGGTTRAAIDLLAAGERDAGRAVWEASGRNAAANGSLMRCAPLGVRYADRATRLAAVFDDGALTHFDPRCQLACAALTGAIARAGDAIAIAEEELAAAAVALAARYPDLDVAGAERALADDLAAARADDPGVDAMHHQGFVRTAFCLAFWAVAHARSYEEGVIDIVNLGGDADTNGAIAGALLGSRYPVPARWRERVLACTPPEPWGTRYHPRELVSAVASSSGSAPRRG